MKRIKKELVSQKSGRNIWSGACTFRWAKQTLETSDPWIPLKVSYKPREMNLIWWKAVHISDRVTTRRGSQRPAECPGQRQTDSSWCAPAPCVPNTGKVVGTWRACALEQKDLSLPATEARLHHSDRCHMRLLEAVSGNVGDRERPSPSRSLARIMRFAVSGKILSGSRWQQSPNKDSAWEENPVLFLAQQMEANRYNPFTGLWCHASPKTICAWAFLWFPLLFARLFLLALARFMLPAEPAVLKVNSISFPPLGEEKSCDIGVDLGDKKAPKCKFNQPEKKMRNRKVVPSL